MHYIPRVIDIQYKILRVRSTNTKQRLVNWSAKPVLFLRLSFMCYMHSRVCCLGSRSPNQVYRTSSIRPNFSMRLWSGVKTIECDDACPCTVHMCTPLSLLSPSSLPCRLYTQLLNFQSQRLNNQEGPLQQSISQLFKLIIKNNHYNKALS